MGPGRTGENFSYISPLTDRNDSAAVGYGRALPALSLYHSGALRAECGRLASLGNSEAISAAVDDFPNYSATVLKMVSNGNRSSGPLSLPLHTMNSVKEEDYVYWLSPVLDLFS